MKTPILKEDDVERAWKLVDASGKTVGRLATKVAFWLAGKHKPAYSPHQDWGDYVVIINAEKARFTGKKADQKTYFTHSGYPGGQRIYTYKEMMQKRPADVVKHAIEGMIKHKSALGRRIAKKLFIYTGPDHPHGAQKPESVEL
ncbi:MAG: 50S ribosomal protein L13 [Elusimicrobia bacterium RIFOXYB2_FULL_49_7]|nr:MAG: 50S ribosomal protein L13 [Elusimicrobia bacterium RIFOXYB2_FULL_49_7]